MSLIEQPVVFEVDNSQNWRAQINDLDLDGNPIAHTGEDLRILLKDASGANPVDVRVSNGLLSILPGTTHSLFINVPWSTTNGLPGGTYSGPLVKVIDANNREVICTVEFRHSVVS